MKDTENKMYYDKYLKYKYKYNILRGGENPSFTNLDLNFTYGTLLAISGYVFESLDTSKRGEFTLNKNNLKVKGDKALYWYNNKKSIFQLLNQKKTDIDKELKKQFVSFTNTLANYIKSNKTITNKEKSEIDLEDQTQNTNHINNIINSIQKYKTTSKIYKCDKLTTQKDKILENLKNELDLVLTKNITALALLQEYNTNCIDLDIIKPENSITNITNIFNDMTLIKLSKLLIKYIKSIILTKTICRNYFIYV
jgi:hypothetical protein